MFRPKEAATMTTAVKLQVRVETLVSGAKEISYIDATLDPIIYCNFKTYGGTESVNNGLLTILDTATVVTWYRPEIKGSSRFIVLQDESIWEVVGNPENIEMRNQFLRFKVKRLAGGA